MKHLKKILAAALSGVLALTLLECIWSMLCT